MDTRRSNRSLALGLNPPPDLRVRFRSEIEKISYAKRVRDTLLPSCDSTTVAVLAWRYVHATDSQARERKKRGARARKKLVEIGREATARGDQQAALDAQDKLGKTNEAFATKRLGVSANHEILFVLREYIRFRSGADVGPSDLAAVIDAAKIVAGYTHKSGIGVDPDALRKNLQRFESRNPVICKLLRDSLPATADYLDRPLIPS